MTVAIAVDWSGPFSSISAAKETAKSNELGEAIYLAVGRRKRQRSTRMQYVGISGDPKSRINQNHHKLPDINSELGLWVGKVVSHAVAGRKRMKLSVMVNSAEWALAFFLELPLNDRKRRRPPDRSLILLNRWFNPDFSTRRVHRGHEDWPDLIEYEHPVDGDEGAVIVWFGGRRDRLSAAEVHDLAKPPVSQKTK